MKKYTNVELATLGRSKYIIKLTTNPGYANESMTLSSYQDAQMAFKRACYLVKHPFVDQDFKGLIELNNLQFAFLTSGLAVIDLFYMIKGKKLY